MTKEEYEDFVLRYKGCGACFPLYHKLSRFEKMWFTAIQKDVAELENRNLELLQSCEGATMMYKQLTKAKEIIRALLKHTHGQNLNTQNDFDLYLGRIKEAEQFLKVLKGFEVEK